MTDQMSSATPSRHSQRIDGNASSALTDPPRFASKHYSIGEIASLWGLSDDYVRRIFANEPGVLELRSEAGKYRKRRYTTLRIPENVLERVHRRLTRGVDSRHVDDLS
jgi:hypothetical protein